MKKKISHLYTHKNNRISNRIVIELFYLNNDPKKLWKHIILYKSPESIYAFLRFKIWEVYLFDSL